METAGADDPDGADTAREQAPPVASPSGDEDQEGARSAACYRRLRAVFQVGIALLIPFLIASSHWEALQEIKAESIIKQSEQLCLLTRNETFTYKNWCDKPLSALLKHGDNFCTYY